MVFSRGGFNSKKKPASQEGTTEQKYCLLNEAVFPGLLFKKDVNNTQSKRTTLRNRLSVVFDENVIAFDWTDINNESDLSQIHACFSTMVPNQSKFTLRNARYVNDLYSIDRDISTEYTFLNFINGNLVVAKAPSDFANYDKTRWEGKFFTKTPQIETTKFSSSKKIDKLINLVSKPDFDEWGIMPGDIIKVNGTKYNDEMNSMVIAISGDKNEIFLSEVLSNESTIGLPIIIQHHRTCSSIGEDNIYVPQEPIEISVSGKSKGPETRCPSGHVWNEKAGTCIKELIRLRPRTAKEIREIKSRITSRTSFIQRARREAPAIYAAPGLETEGLKPLSFEGPAGGSIVAFIPSPGGDEDISGMPAAAPPLPPAMPMMPTTEDIIY